MSDIRTALARSIQRVSIGGRFFFTERQLYYEFCRTLRPYAQYLRGIPFSLPLPVSYAEFSRALKHHISCGGMPTKLLAASQSLPPGFIGQQPDLADYGLPRVLVCTDRDVAEMIIANHMHMKLGCAVLSLAGAVPLADLICAMLARDQDPRVFLLHDADLEGMTLFSHLRVRLRIPEDMTPVEIGLRPFQAAKMHLFVERTDSWTGEQWHLPGGLTRFERLWVKAGLRAEVAGISPAVLFRLLRQTIVLGR
jgi:hypothetical protein